MAKLLWNTIGLGNSELTEGPATLGKQRHVQLLRSKWRPIFQSSGSRVKVADRESKMHDYNRGGVVAITTYG